MVVKNRLNGKIATLCVVDAENRNKEALEEEFS